MAPQVSLINNFNYINFSNLVCPDSSVGRAED